MPSHELLLCDLRSGSIIGRLPASSFDYSDDLNRPGSFGISLPLNTAQAPPSVPVPYRTEFEAMIASIGPSYWFDMFGALDGFAVEEITFAAPSITTDDLAPGKRSVFILRDGQIVFGGIVWGLDADVAGNTLKVSGSEIDSYFFRRNIRANLSFVGTDQALIADALVDLAAAGGPPITTTGATHGKTRDRTYLAIERKGLGEALTQLAEVEGGFDFSLAHSRSGNAFSSEFRTSYPATGRETDLLFEIGTNVAVMSYSISGADIANVAETIGSGQGDESMVAIAASGDDGFPRLEVVESYTDVRNRSTLQGHANRLLAERSTPLERVALSLYGESTPNVGSYATGDVVTVWGSYGAISLDDRYRIISKSVSVNTNGLETVSLDLVPRRLFQS